MSNKQGAIYYINAPMKKIINKVAVPIGFILEVSLFVTAGWHLGRTNYIIGLIIFLFGFGVALFVGELIRRKV